MSKEKEISVDASLPSAVENGEKRPLSKEPPKIYVCGLNVSISWLLGDILSIIDSSIPNKDQNRSVKHLVRKSFDRTMHDIYRSSLSTYKDEALSKAGYLVNPYQ